MGYRFGLALCLVAWPCGHALADNSDFAKIEGDWVIVTEHRLGETVSFKRVFGGYEAFVSWWGATAITDSNGAHNSHVKITGTRSGMSIACFYDVSMLDKDDMVWAFRFGKATTCPGSVEYKRLTAAEIQRHIDRGNALIGDDDDTALAEFSAALDRDRSNAVALNGMGNVYLDKRMYAEAIAKFSAAIASDNRIASFYANRCDAYLANDDFDAAISSGSKAISLDAKTPDAYLCRAKAYMEVEDWRDALVDLRTADKLEPDDDELKSMIRETIDMIHKP